MQFLITFGAYIRDLLLSLSLIKIGISVQLYNDCAAGWHKSTFEFVPLVLLYLNPWYFCTYTFGTLVHLFWSSVGALVPFV